LDDSVKFGGNGGKRFNPPVLRMEEAISAMVSAGASVMILPAIQAKIPITGEPALLETILGFKKILEYMYIM